MRPIIIAGPTASGKSRLALDTAKALNGAIICADSRQLYRHMRIGSAGPSIEETKTVPHFGYHELAPAVTYDAGRFIVDTDASVVAAQNAGLRPIITGGAGLYLRALRFGLDDVPPADKKVRAEIEARLEAAGAPSLHDELRAKDPESADRISQNDSVRIVRALEVISLTGRPASEQRKQDWTRPPRFEADWVLLDADMTWLEGRIESRAQWMFRNGLPAEAILLRDRLGPTHPKLSTMGYQEALLMSDGLLDEATAVERTYRRQRQYAKRQRTWFQKEPWWHRIRLDDTERFSAPGSVLEAVCAQLDNSPV